MDTLILITIIAALGLGLHLGARLSADAQVQKNPCRMWRKYLFLAGQRVSYKAFAHQVDSEDETVAQTFIRPQL
jgi:hypothetical protein